MMILLLGVKAAVVAGETRAVVGRERQLVVGQHNVAVSTLSSVLTQLDIVSWAELDANVLTAR